MPINFLRFAGLRIVPASYDVKETNNHIQAWHETSFMQMAEEGFHLIYEGETTYVNPTKIEPPFIDLSDKLYALDVDGYIQTNNKVSIMIQPLPDYYLDNSLPCPLPCLYQTDWFPGPLRIVFAKQKSLFEKNKPFAHLICLPRYESNTESFTDEELDHMKLLREFIGRYQDSWITRKWVSKTGVEQTNTYNVLVEMAERDKLPQDLVNKTKRRLFNQKKDLSPR